ncbi:hypothetical protein WN55_05990 [Dufourea novaeangliae]|uniref:Uncharacterized protein n=1 Tax=Dufourea novaeangliae TaxID=178035 RepID=A0A154PNH5_DUFNO|nr:hypothetical protein WN55_05990 [Dufourea novaeangliae]
MTNRASWELGLVRPQGLGTYGTMTSNGTNVYGAGGVGSPSTGAEGGGRPSPPASLSIDRESTVVPPGHMAGKAGNGPTLPPRGRAAAPPRRRAAASAARPARSRSRPAVADGGVHDAGAGGGEKRRRRRRKKPPASAVVEPPPPPPARTRTGAPGDPPTGPGHPDRWSEVGCGKKRPGLVIEMQGWCSWRWFGSLRRRRRESFLRTVTKLLVFDEVTNGWKGLRGVPRNCDIVNLKKEWVFLYTGTSVADRNNWSKLSFDDMWINMGNRENPQNTPQTRLLPHITQLVSIVRCLPHSNAKSEWIFSMLPDIKSRKRNKSVRSGLPVLERATDLLALGAVMQGSGTAGYVVTVSDVTLRSPVHVGHLNFVFCCRWLQEDYKFTEMVSCSVPGCRSGKSKVKSYVLPQEKKMKWCEAPEDGTSLTAESQFEELEQQKPAGLLRKSRTMPPFANKYKRAKRSFKRNKKGRNSSRCSDNGFHVEELLVVSPSNIETASVMCQSGKSSSTPNHCRSNRHTRTLSVAFDVSHVNDKSIPPPPTEPSFTPSRVATRISFDLIASFIPHFDGKSCSVANFMVQCRLADSLVKPDDKFYLLALIRNRMQRRDYSRIVGDSEPKTVEEFINLMKATYEQNFDILSVQDELKTIQRKDNET